MVVEDPLDDRLHLQRIGREIERRRVLPQQTVVREKDVHPVMAGVVRDHVHTAVGEMAEHIYLVEPRHG